MNKKERPTCRFCGSVLTREDLKYTGGTSCLDCAITYLGGAAHQMAEGIRKSRAQEGEPAATEPGVADPPQAHE